MRVGAVILAAGASTRLGELKQLQTLGSETLLERTLRVVREAGCSPMVVVLGASAALIQAACDFGDSVSVINEDWADRKSVV